MAYSLHGLILESAPALQVQSKLCAAIGEQPNPGDEPVVVGEINIDEREVWIRK